MLLAWLALLAAHAQDSQRAAAAKQGRLQNVTVATSTRSSVRRKRTVVTSTKVCSAVEVVHATVSARRQSSASTYASVVSQCHKLHPDVFWECGRPREWLQVSACDKRAPASLEGAYFSFRCEGSTPRANERCSSSSADSLHVAVMQAHRPCTDHAFVAKIRDAYVADNRVHQAVPGTVFTDNFVFRWQAYVRDVPDGSPSEWPDPPKVHSYACLASGVPATVCACRPRSACGSCLSSCGHLNLAWVLAQTNAGTQRWTRMEVARRGAPAHAALVCR